MTPEKKVKQKITAVLKSLGIAYTIPIGSGFGMAGTSDYICCVSGRFVAIEAKATHQNLMAPLQELFFKKVQASGGITLLIHATNAMTLEGTLRGIMNEEGDIRQ